MAEHSTKTCGVKRIRRLTVKEVMRKELQTHQLVVVLIRVLTDLEQVHNRRPRNIMAMKVVMDKHSKYYKALYSTVEYLQSLRDDYGSKIPFDKIATDFLATVYEHYSKFRVAPFITQFAANPDNITRFSNWIGWYEDHYGESYWDQGKEDIQEMRKEAKALADRHKDKSVDDSDKAYPVDIDIVEV